MNKWINVAMNNDSMVLLSEDGSAYCVSKGIVYRLPNQDECEAIINGYGGTLLTFIVNQSSKQVD